MRAWRATWAEDGVTARRVGRTVSGHQPNAQARATRWSTLACESGWRRRDPVNGHKPLKNCQAACKPFSRKIRNTAIRRAAGDNARGHGERVLLRLFRRGLLDAVADQGAEEEQQAVVPMEGPGQAQAGRGRNPLLVLWEQGAKSGRMMPTRPPMAIDQIFTGPSESRPWLRARATARHVCGRRGRETVGAQHATRRAPEPGSRVP